MITTIKDGIHVVAIDDSPHKRGDLTTEVFFVYCKSTFLENVTHSSITVDGMDSTQVILGELKKKSENFTLILLHGITVGGLNIIDISHLSEALEKPVIAVTENPPTLNSILNAITHLPDLEKRNELIKKAGPIFSFTTNLGDIPLSYHKIGLDNNLVHQFFNKFYNRSRLPEQILLAHKIASAWK